MMGDLNEGGITKFFLHCRNIFLTAKIKEFDSYAMHPVIIF